jgi:hypothetical protein
MVMLDGVFKCDGVVDTALAMRRDRCGVLWSMQRRWNGVFNAIVLPPSPRRIPAKAGTGPSGCRVVTPANAGVQCR